MSDDTMYVCHQLTRLGNSCEELLIDPGAFDNLSGDRWVARMSILARNAGRRIAYRSIAKPVKVEGVGDGQEQSGVQAIVLGVMKASDGRLVESEYHVPIRP
eukprot:977840-Karenia_brevis.AAC.1